MATLDRPPLTTEPPRVLTPEELQARWQAAYPEARGAGCEDGVSGSVIYDHPPDPRIGAIPQRLTTAEIEQENARRQALLDAMTPAERAAQENMRAMIREEIRHV